MAMGRACQESDAGGARPGSPRLRAEAPEGRRIGHRHVSAGKQVCGGGRMRGPLMAGMLLLAGSAGAEAASLVLLPVKLLDTSQETRD